MLLLGFLASASVAADPIEPIQFSESYGGVYRDDFSALLGQAKSIVPNALAYITGQWNLSNTLHSPLIVIISDTPPNLAVGAIAYVRSVIVGGMLRQTLVVDLQHHRLYPSENIEPILYHEMAHAVLQDAVVAPGAAGIPQWFTEGLAQSVTMEGHDRTAEDFKRYGHSDAGAVLCDLNGQVDVFYHGESNFGCYTQFYLAVQRLLALGGKDAMPSLIAGLHSGVPLPIVITQVTRLSWPAFQQNVAQYTRDVFSGSQPIP